MVIPLPQRWGTCSPRDKCNPHEYWVWP